MTGLYLPPAVPARPEVAILVVAPDPAGAAELEQALEVRLGASGVVVLLPSSDVARALAGPTVAPALEVPPERAVAEALYKAAHAAYIEADYRSANSTVDRMAGMIDRLAAADRARAHELAAAVHFKLEDDPGALREAMAAITLAGGLPPDLGEYPPSVQHLFEEANASVRRVTLSFTGAPPGTQVAIDDRPATASSITLPAGSHRMHVEAPGFRTVEREVEVNGDLTVSLALAPALDTNIERLLVAVLQPGAPASDLRALSTLAARLSVRALAIAVRTGTDSEAGVFWAFKPDEVSRLGSFGTAAANASAVAERIGGAIESGPLREKRTETPDSGWNTDLGILALRSDRQISGGASAGFQVRFAGAGPEIRVGFRTGPLAMEGEGAFVSYDPSRAVFAPPGSAAVTVTGGTTIHAALRLLYSLPAGDFTITPLADVCLEDHSAHDVASAGILPSYTWLAPEIGVHVSLALASAWRGSLEGRLSPTSVWLETPSGASGTNPRGEVGYSGRAGIERITGPWTIGAVALYENRSASFSGTAKPPVLPAITNAHVSETFLGAALQVARHF